MPFADYLAEAETELRRVRWPTRATVRNNTKLVVASLAGLTALLAGLDYLFGEIVFRLFGSGS